MYDLDDEYRDHVAMAERWTHQEEAGDCCYDCGAPLSVEFFYQLGGVCMECAAIRAEQAAEQIRGEERGWTT